MKEVASWRMEWLRRVNMIYDVAKNKPNQTPTQSNPFVMCSAFQMSIVRLDCLSRHEKRNGVLHYLSLLQKWRTLFKANIFVKCLSILLGTYGSLTSGIQI